MEENYDPPQFHRVSYCRQTQYNNITVTFYSSLRRYKKIHMILLPCLTGYCLLLHCSVCSFIIYYQQAPGPGGFGGPKPPRFPPNEPALPPRPPKSNVMPPPPSEPVSVLLHYIF